jgi:hypothetical protein
MILGIVGLLQVIVGCSALLIWRRRKEREMKRLRFVGCLEKQLGAPLRYTLSE